MEFLIFLDDRQIDRYLFKYMSIYIDINFHLIRSNMYQYIKLKIVFLICAECISLKMDHVIKTSFILCIIQRTELGSNKVMWIVVHH